MYIISIFVDGVTSYGIVMLPPKAICYPTKPQHQAWEVSV